MGDAVDFKWYRYLSDEGLTFAIKQNKTWGDNVDAGFFDFDDQDPPMVKSPSLRPRQITLQDPETGRLTTRSVGSPSADAWTTRGYTTTVNYPGLATPIVVTKIDRRGERIRQARAIISKAEPS